MALSKASLAHSGVTVFCTNPHLSQQQQQQSLRAHGPEPRI